jgi:pyruvate dehydrogenase E2 component (dihydrolipoamide acetyltransferase)
MVTKVFMEALSPTMEEGKLLTWHKNEGDEVFDGDVLAEVETDKAVMELQARAAGVLRKILAPAGSTVDVGSVVGVIAEAGEDISGIEERQETKKPETGSAAERQETERPDTGTAAEPPEAAPATPSAPGRHKSSPLARRLAQERGLDLGTVSGSGPGGRIIKRDVVGAEAVAPAAVPSAASGYEDVELSQIRKTIARRLSESLGPVPHFFLTTEVDMEHAAEARAQLNELEDGPRISFNDIILKVVATALKQHRECNAWWQTDHIRYFDEVHIGMAVAVTDGLITPVIRNAHLKTLREIAGEAQELAGRARDRKLAPEEYTGGTFSVSNLGMFDIDQFTAVINPPEAGIIAVGSIAERPIVVDRELEIRKRMRITMSCDHRVIDGATGARFLQSVKRMLENPLAMVW